MTPVATTGNRQTSGDRREQVVAAAIEEFGEQGYQATSTAAVARRAGISQPYIYALFPNKQALFLAAHDKVIRRITDRFSEAARGVSGPPILKLHAMGQTYPELIGDRGTLLVQLQAYAAAGDPDIGPHVSRCFRELRDSVAALSGASDAEVARFFAAGMLANVTTILGVPDICEPLWADDPQDTTGTHTARDEDAVSA